MATSFTPWMHNTDGLSPDAESAIGPSQPTPFFRDPLDRARSVLDQRTPGGQYPDGYLGPIQSRRERLYDMPARNVLNRPFDQAGRVGADMYVWPEEFNLSSGIQNQATTGMRYVSPGMQLESANPAPADTDPDRIRELAKMAPPWSSGGPSLGTYMPLRPGS